jgi:hypothetical protein
MEKKEELGWGFIESGTRACPDTMARKWWGGRRHSKGRYPIAAARSGTSAIILHSE